MQSDSPKDDVERSEHSPPDAERAQPAPPAGHADEQDDMDSPTASEPSGGIFDQTAQDFALDSGPAADASDDSDAPSDMSSPLLDALHATEGFTPADADPADSQSSDEIVAPLDGLEFDTAPDSSPVEIDTDLFVAPDDSSSDLYTSPFGEDDADLRSETGSSSLDLVNPAADAMTFEISMGADLSSDAPVEDATFRGGVYISGRDAEGPVEVPFPARDGFNETQSGMPSATSADVPADFARPIGWNAGGGHTDVGTSFGSAGADAGSSRVEVSVSVRMSREELERISAVAARVAAESSERAIEKRFFDLRTEQFQRDAQLRACWGR